MEKYRFDAIDNLEIHKCSYYKTKNYGRLGNDVLDGAYVKSHQASKRKGYTGAESYGINLAYCSNVKITDFFGDKLVSKNGNSIGINVIFNSNNVKLEGIKLHDIRAGTLYKGNWIGENYYGKKVTYENKLPNKRPQSIGINYENNSVIQLKDVCIKDLHSCEKPVKIKKN